MTTATKRRDDAVEQFERDGYVIIRDVLDADLMAEASDHVAWLHAQHPGRPQENLSKDLVPDDPFWLRLVSDERLLNVAEMFVGPDIALYATHYISKPPFSGKPVLWHQDGAFWPLDPMKVVTLWLAVDDSTPENGCVRVIPGSHREELHQVRDTKVDGVLPQEAAVDVDESHAVDLVLAPGDVEVHHPNIMHGSNANTSAKRRCGLTIRYIPTSTRILTEEQPSICAFLMRGEPGVNIYQPWPTYRDGEHFRFREAAAWKSR